LNAPDAGRDDEDLPARMRVPNGPSAWLERYGPAGHVPAGMGREQLLNLDGTREAVTRSGVHGSRRS
jgi:hypothetical protein